MITVLGKLTPREELSAEVPAREAGRFWRGVPNYALASRLVQQLYRRGILIVNEQWSEDRAKGSLVGGLDLKVPDAPDLPGMNYSLGLRHSNDGRQAIQLACGARVAVCSNGLITGTFILRCRHTLRLNLDAELASGVERYLQEASRVKNCIDGLQQQRIDEPRYREILIESGRRNLLPWSALGKVDQEYRNPQHTEFREWRNTGWGLYNAYNEITKQLAPTRQLSALNQLRELVMN